MLLRMSLNFFRSSFVNDSHLILILTVFPSSCVRLSRRETAFAFIFGLPSSVFSSVPEITMGLAAFDYQKVFREKIGEYNDLHDTLCVFQGQIGHPVAALCRDFFHGVNDTGDMLHLPKYQSLSGFDCRMG